MIAVLAFLLVCAVHLAAVYFLANDYDDDGVLYEGIAQNIVEHHSFSTQSAPPYRPTAVRMPGYPFFLAGIYEVCGVNRLWAVRAAQAFIHSITCVLVDVLAALWEPRTKRRRLAAVAAFAWAAICPFTLIYAACILTETLTMCFVVALVLCATLAWSRTGRQAVAWWMLAGMFGGLAELLRPDAGLFTAAIGLRVAAGVLPRVRQGWAAALSSLRPAIGSGLWLSLGFVLAVSPWLWRNAAVFHCLQLLPPLNFGEP